MITPTSLNEAFLAKVRVAAREAMHCAAVASLYTGEVEQERRSATVTKLF